MASYSLIRFIDYHQLFPIYIHNIKSLQENYKKLLFNNLKLCYSATSLNPESKNRERSGSALLTFAFEQVL